ncbi:MAG: vWA domain-containing protein [Pseudomonadota bacterium]
MMKRSALTVAGLLAAAALTVTANAKPQSPITPITDTPIMNAVSSYILLDRTGSMSDIWDEALSSVNAYAAAIGKVEEGEADDLQTSVTLAVFDYQEGFQFDVLRERVTPDAWTQVTQNDVSPRGMTPLFDAINRTITMAEADNPEKAVIVIMTDGHENSSREVTRAGAKAALDRAEARGWEVVFLGAEFSSFGDADAVGVARSKQMAVSSGSLAMTQERLARKARDYGKGETEDIEFDAEDRAIAEEEAVKERNGSNR